MDQVENRNGQGGLLAGAALLWRALTRGASRPGPLEALRPLVRAASQPMLLRDLNGRELLCNEAWQMARGLPGIDLQQRAPETGGSGTLVVTGDRSRTFSLSRFPLHDGHGELVGDWTVLQPMDGRGRTAAVESALAAVGAGTVCVHPGGTTELDDRACALLGLVDEAPGALSLQAALRHADPNDRQRLVQALDTATGAVAGHLRVGSGKERRVLRGQCDADGRFTGLVLPADPAGGPERAPRDTAVGAWVYDCRSSTLYWDEAMYRLCDIEQGSLGGRVEDVFARIHPDDQKAVQNAIAHALNTSDGYQSQARVMDRSGQPRLMLSRAAVARDADGEPLSMIGVSWIAEQHGHDHPVSDLYARPQLHTDDALLTGPNFSVLCASTRFLSSTGWSGGSLAAHTLDDLISRAGDGTALSAHLRRFSHWDGPVRLRRADGTLTARHARVRAMLDDDGLIRHYAVTLWQEAGATTAPVCNAAVDAFTGALTPHAALQALTRLLRERKAGQAVLALSLDVNDFRLVNEAHGHAAGDRVLQTLVRRLGHALPTDYIVGRVIGDEFLVAGPSPDDIEAWHAIAELVLTHVRHPVDLPDGLWKLTANAGVASAPMHGDTAHALLSAAQSARGGSAQRGRDRYALYHPEQARPSSHSYRLNSELARAVELRDFDLLYEPVVELGSGRVAGVGVRVRWPHPRLGSLAATPAVAPHVDGEAMEAAEHRVLQQVCAQALTWQRDDFEPNWVALGIAPAQFHRAGFVDSLRAALNGTGLAPEALRLEIGESTVMQNPFEARRVLSALRALGLRVTLEGVGTRRTSLGFLRNFPVDTLKVDGGCISGLPESEGDRALLGAVMAVALAHSLEVIAEGVRTRAQLDSLLSLGCPLAQGPLLGAPQPAEELSRRLRAEAARSEPAQRT